MAYPATMLEPMTKRSVEDVRALLALAAGSERGGGEAWRAYSIAAVLVAGATVAGYLWTSIPDPRNLSLVFFGAILIAGVTLGLRPALFAALLSFFFYNFFLIDPRYELHFAAADILAFASFLGGAIFVGGLSGRLSDRARDATSRLHEVTALFEASRELSRAIAPREAAIAMARHLEHSGWVVAVWLGDGGALELAALSEGADARSLESLGDARAFLASGLEDEIAETRWLLRLQTAERILGAVAIWPGDAAASLAQKRRWVGAMLELGAVAIDRARLINEVADATVVAEKEGLRTALLSSLSHDLRTPIATILASVTSLQEHGALFDAATRRDMLETIQSETERLNRYVANLLEMTRLESGALSVRSALIDPGEAMASALARFKLAGKSCRIVRRFQSEGERILVDPVLIEQALVNVLENAFLHAPAGSTVSVGASRDAGSILLSVEDEGSGIPLGDLERVFDRFFRGRSDRRAGAGVGLGLSVTRGLVEAFGGQVRAVSPASGGKGARVEIRLPAHPAMEPLE